MNKWTTRAAAALATAVLAAGLTACTGSDSSSDSDDRAGAHPTRATVSEAETRCVQQAVNWFQEPRVTVDGDYDAKTRAAVGRYQHKHGLAGDGEMGAPTGRALFDDVNKVVDTLLEGPKDGSAKYRDWLGRCDKVVRR
ncbi:peptidoglycan-binding domain-containing protein [Streptomyces xanthii]|uniref:Peptidoglycan-binding protein n=1 Tax=Streptomyces xanthii TaxID=2768069 RepID=A0A7H1B7D4_9ACTN|nr:peptidoglycan-binding domain-containing protein [Streptomyces xanthii]QNS04639.1 peptidoglycan-binding protein [Streptomyces xanthii]